MANLSKEIHEKCKALWNGSQKVSLRFPELRNKNVLSQEEIVLLQEHFKWTDRQNCAEIIGGVALNLPSKEIRCKITNDLIRFCVPFYRLYTDEEILNLCYRTDRKNVAKYKWDWSLCRDYNKEALEILCSCSTTHNVFKCPMMINHCYVWALEQGLNISLIANPAEAFYLWKNKISSFPLCPITNEKLKFGSGTYPTYSKAGVSVINKQNQTGRIISEDQIQKRKQTNLKKYGTTAYVNLPEVRMKGTEIKKQKAEIRKQILELEKKTNPPSTRQEKYKKTMTDLYGGPTMKAFLEKNPRSKENKERASKKAKETWKAKYGTENIQELSEVRNKIRNTNEQKYGKSCYLSTPEQTEHRKHLANINTYNNFKRFADYCVPLFSLEEWLADTKKEFQWKLVSTGELYTARYWGYAPIGNFTHSTLEKFVHEILKEWNIQYIVSDRKTIAPRELDIFIPSKNLAIECNGEFFHSDKKLGRYYHESKRKECEQKNIRLLQFFGNEIQQRPKAIKSVIRYALNLNGYKIYARNTKVCKVSSSLARKFYDKYHIHGFCGASVHYGLLLRGKLVQMLSIGTNRFETNNRDKEIIRSATAYNFNVIGGVSKLVNAVRKDFPFCDIHTYVDLSCFTGKGYEASKFVYKNTTPPSYFYFKNVRSPIYSRYQTQKHKLKNIIGESFDSNKTEEENMLSFGYYKVYRCSHKHFLLQAKDK